MIFCSSDTILVTFLYRSLQLAPCKKKQCLKFTRSYFFWLCGDFFFNSPFSLHPESGLKMSRVALLLLFFPKRLWLLLPSNQAQLADLTRLTFKSKLSSATTRKLSRVFFSTFCFWRYARAITYMSEILHTMVLGQPAVNRENGCGRPKRIPEKACDPS